MTVLSRLLFGTMRVTTYDWTKPDNGSSSVPPSRRPYSDPSIDGRAPAGPPGLAIRGRAQQVACETLTAPEDGFVSQFRSDKDEICIWASCHPSLAMTTPL